jgi:hypothetical protein
MFIKWKIRPSSKKKTISWYAYLARHNHGKRHVSYLGRVITFGERIYQADRDRFWARAEKKLTQLSLSDDQCAVIRAALAKRVPPPPSV